MSGTFGCLRGLRGRGGKIRNPKHEIRNNVRITGGGITKTGSCFASSFRRPSRRLVPRSQVALGNALGGPRAVQLPRCLPFPSSTWEREGRRDRERERGREGLATLHPQFSILASAPATPFRDRTLQSPRYRWHCSFRKAARCKRPGAARRRCRIPMDSPGRARPQ